MSNESDVERGTVGATGGKGLLKAVEAKLLCVVDVTFCSILKDGANFCYLDHLTFGASVARCKLAKRGSGDSVSAASPMIKSTKGCRRGRKKFAQLELHLFPS